MNRRKLEEDFEKHKPYFIDKGSDYICGTCRKVWHPTEEDVNRKRPSCYYKGCTSCRFKSYTKARYYKSLKGNNYDALYDNNKNNLINTRTVEEEDQHI